MTRLEKIQKIKELLAKKEDLTDEQRLKFGQIISSEEAKENELEANKADTKPSFSARIGVSPFEGMMNAVVEEQRKSGVPTSETTDMMKQGLVNAVDLGTGAGLVRAGVGELAGGSYLDSNEALLNAITKGVPMDILEKEQVLKDSPKAQWLADAIVNAADPGLLMAGAGLLKQGIKSGGKSMYQSGLKNIDKMTLKKGKGMNAFSDVAMKHGIAGSSQDIMEQTDNVVEALMKERDALFADAAANGAVVDPAQALKPVVQQAEAVASNTKKFGTAAKKQAGNLAEEMRLFGQENMVTPMESPSGLMGTAPKKPGLTPQSASSVKTDMYNMLGSNAFDVLRTDKEGQKLLKRAANRMNIATTNAVKSVDPQAAKRLLEINKDMGALLTGRPAAFNEFSKEVTKNALTSVDAPLAILNPGAFLGKKAADIGKTAEFRTQAGKLLSNDIVAKILGGAGAVGTKGLLNAATTDRN